MEDKVVFSVPWFDILERPVEGSDSPYYCLRTNDYVAVLAETTDRSFLLVRQHRPAVGAETLELPSGHIEEGELPEAAARRELIEETGYRAEKLEFLGAMIPDTGRIANRLWCFYAENVTRSNAPVTLEEGIELVKYQPLDLLRDVSTGKINHALHLAVLFLAVTKGRLWTDQTFRSPESHKNSSV